MATSDVPHFVSKITRHKTLLSHFFEAFSHCTLSLILGQSQPNFRLLSITLSYFAGTEAEILKWAFWRLQRPAVTFGETKSSVTGVPENRSICMCVWKRERNTALLLTYSINLCQPTVQCDADIFSLIKSSPNSLPPIKATQFNTVSSSHIFSRRILSTCFGSVYGE